tara:strand:+ start:278 stop:619 length:342 start_codon:yes stop_codon:yes gene_type:complete
MKDLHEEKLSTTIEIDLSAARCGKLTENYLESFGAQVAIALERILAGAGGGLNLTGNKSEIQSFVDALTSESDYIGKYQQFGLSNPSTLQSADKLKNAIQQFETQTGLAWPLK